MEIQLLLKEVIKVDTDGKEAITHIITTVGEEREGTIDAVPREVLDEVLLCGHAEYSKKGLRGFCYVDDDYDVLKKWLSGLLGGTRINEHAESLTPIAAVEIARRYVAGDSVGFADRFSQTLQDAGLEECSKAIDCAYDL